MELSSSVSIVPNGLGLCVSADYLNLTLNKYKTMSKENTSKEAVDLALRKTNVVRSFVNVKLNRKDVEDMISTYEFLAWENEGDERKFCKKILRALRKSLE